MPKPEKLIFVCSNQRPPGHPRGSCNERGAREILMKFSELLDAKGLWGKVLLSTTSCLGPCYEGPVVSILPDNIWYGNLQSRDVENIVEDHIINGKPLEKLQIPDDAWG
jgi:(2Fe-2S) ferredoxin